LGSGVIVSPKGYIVTSNHVVENAKDIKVSLSDGREYIATLVGSDPKSDLAVLKIAGNVPTVAALPFGDSGKLRLGEVVLAIGNPFGVGQTVTMGIVSAKGRADVGIVDYEDFIQTDAAINPGNSGGALVNLRGELVGINTAILSRSGGYQGIGFAIPSDMAEPIMRSLLTHGKVVRGWLGVEVQTFTPELARALKIPHQPGTLVTAIVDGSPAQKAGLKQDDVVLSINGKPTPTANRLRNAVGAVDAGHEAQIEVVRGGQRKILSSILTEQPKDRVASGEGAPSGEFGATVSKLSKGLRAQYRLPAKLDRGVVITQVAPGGFAANLGLRPGDVILEVNRQPISTPKALDQALASAERGVALLIYRDGSTVYLAFSK
jgi:serine protease Do